MEAKGKEFKIVHDGKEVGSITFGEDGVNIRCTGEGRKMCKHFHSGGGCC